MQRGTWMYLVHQVHQVHLVHQVHQVRWGWLTGARRMRL